MKKLLNILLLCAGLLSAEAQIVQLPQPVQTITTWQASSLSLAVALDTSYTLSRMQDMSIYIDNTEVARKTASNLADTIVGTNNPRVFVARFSSKRMAKYAGIYSLQIAIYDALLGVRRTAIIRLNVLPSQNALVNTSVNTGIDATVNVTLSSSQVSTNALIATVMQGYSAYEIAVQNGFVGTQQEWLASLAHHTHPQSDITNLVANLGAKSDTSHTHTTAKITDWVSAWAARFAAQSTSNLSEGSNLYYTQSRFNTAFSAKSTSDLAEGSNLYWTNARGDARYSLLGHTHTSANITDWASAWDTRLSLKTTTNLAEGTNLYWTQARFNTAFSGKSTSDLAEGTNLYHTTTRVQTVGDVRYGQLSASQTWSAVNTFSGLLQSGSNIAWTNGGTTGSSGKNLHLAYDNANSIGYIKSINTGTAFTDLRFGSSSLSFWTGTSSVTERAGITSNGLLYANSGLVIGKNTIASNRLLELSGVSPYIMFTPTVGGSSFTSGVDTYGYVLYDDTNAAYRLNVKNNGNVIIGGFVDAGFKLDVVGTLRAQGNLTATGTTVTLGDATGTSLSTINFGGGPIYKVNGAYNYFVGGLGSGALLLGGASHTAVANASAIAEFISTTKGFLGPRMTSTQRDAISSPAEGLEVYNTTSHTSDQFDGTAWRSIVNTTSFNTLGDARYGQLAGTQTWSGVNTFSQSIIGQASSFSLSSTGGLYLDAATGGTVNLRVNGVSPGITVSSSGINFRVSATEVGRYFSTGNLLLQTGGTFTDAGYKLDVNGTARVAQNLTVGQSSGGSASLYLGSSSQTDSQVAFTQLTNTYYVGVVAGGSFRIRNNNTGTNPISIGHDATSSLSIGGGGGNANFSANVGIGWSNIYTIPQKLTVAGNASIGTEALTPVNHASVLLSLNSVTQGLLPPRQTTDQINAIASPVKGLLVFNTTLNTLCFFDGTIWQKVTSTSMN